jgi:hypothetical protein
MPLPTETNDKVLNNAIDLQLPLSPVIGEFTREELFRQLQDVYNALRILQQQTQNLGDFLQQIGEVAQRQPTMYKDL